MRALLRRVRRRAVRGPEPLRAKLDGIDARELCGWASASGAPVNVELLCGDRVLDAQAAVLPRPDVAAAGAGPLHCGFRFDMARLVEAAARAGASPEDAPLRLRADGAQVASPLAALRADDLIDADALAWFARKGAR